MSLTSDDVRHVARLARLALSDEDVAALQPQLSEILSYAEKVGEVAADDVPPMGHPAGLRNVYRDDEPRRSLSQADAIAAAPLAEDGRFRVPAILGEKPPAGEGSA